MTFSWKSLATIYAVLFYSMMTVIVVIVGRERLEILQNTKKFDDKIYAIIFVIFLIPHFWIPFVGWGERDPSASTDPELICFCVLFAQVWPTKWPFTRQCGPLFR